MSICTSFNQIYAKFPPSPPNSNTKTFKTLTLVTPRNSHNLTIKRVPTKALALSSSFTEPREELPPKLREIIKLFQSVENSRIKTDQLMYYGINLTPLDPQFKTAENKVEGCVSQVWIRAYLESNNSDIVFYESDSDSAITKGLVALLVNGLSGRPVEEILRVSPDFIVLLGLQQSLTPSRISGFWNMLKLMQRKALQLLVEKENKGDLGHENMV